ncbi:MAG: Ig-like domain-containing protein [Candidatus Omnitrophota bacterium]
MSDERRKTSDERRETKDEASVVRRPSSFVRLFALTVIFCILYAAPWPLFSSPTDLDISSNTTWSGDQTIVGTLTVKSGVTLTINSSSGTPITLTATNLVVESGAKITADGKGYAGGTARNNGGGTGGGKGVGANNSRSAGGGGYGGIGGDGTGYASSGGAVYGSSSPPFANGSGGGGGQSVVGGAGGGAIKFVITGKTTLSGPISANGADGTGASYGSGAGAGGSIYLTTSILEGTAGISANGGNAVDGSGGRGGGGRVGLVYDDATGYSGAVSVLAGTTGAGSPADGSTSQSIFSTGGNSGVGPMGVYPNALFTGGSSGTGPKGVGYYYASSAGLSIWSGEGADNLASTAANWLDGTVPVDGSIVVFNETSNKYCTWNLAISPADFTLDNGYSPGIVTLNQDLTVTNSIAVNTTGDRLVDNGRNVNFKNATIAGANCLTSTGIWKMIASGNISNGDASNLINDLRISAGVTATRTANVLARKITLEANALAQGSFTFNLVPTANDFIDLGSGANITDGAVSLQSMTNVTLTQKAITMSAGLNLVYCTQTTIKMSGDWNIGGSLTVFAIADNHSVLTLDTDGYNLTVGSYLMLGASDAGHPNAYYGKVLFKNGTHTIGGGISVANGALAAGGTCYTHGYLDFGSSTVNVGGNVDFRGMSVTPGTSTVNLTGATAATIYSIVDYADKDAALDDPVMNTAPFYNLTSTVAGKTVKFEAGKTVTVANNLTLAGASGNLLTLNSTTDGAYANVNVAGTATGMNYLSVKDSNASSGKPIAATNSTNAGHNQGWAFSGPQDHLGFGSSIANPQAGVLFNLSQLVAHDQSHNVLANFSGAKTITYSISGTSNAPDGNGTDQFYSDGVLNGPVNFSDGVSTSALTAILYRAQDTTITPSEASLAGTDSASNTVTVNPSAASKILFSQQPSPVAVITSPFVQQPKVVIQDTYGNRTHDTFSIKIYSSATSELPFGDAGGLLESGHADNTLAAVNGAATFSGVKYDRSGLIYLYAEALGAGSGLTPTFSTGVSLATAQSTAVTAADSPVTNFNLTPTNDTLGEKFEVLKFKVADLGGDNIPTLIDRLRVTVGGTGGSASTDIAWAGLYTGAVKIADASSITDNTLTFGMAPDGGSTADLYSVGENTATEFTVYIYMKAGKLAATESKTYTFTTNEDKIEIDTGGSSSRMTANTSAVATVTGTVTVVTSHLEVVTIDGDSLLALSAGTPSELLVRATDANKNIDINYGGNRSLRFSGLNSVGTAPVYSPKIENSAFGTNLTIGFVQGVAGGTTVTLSAFKREAGSVVVQEVGKTYVQYGLAVTVNPAVATNIAILSGNNQSGRNSWPLVQPLVAVVTDTYTNGADSGTPVNFAIASQPSGAAGAALSTTAGFTDQNGQVATTFTVGSVSGAYQVTATSAGLAGSPLTFNATALSPTAIQISSGNNQSKLAATALDNPLVVKVVDPSGIAIPNETVNFSISSFPDGATGQVLSVSSAVTDVGGLAQVALTLGTKAGDYKVGVSSGVLTPVEFTATATARAPYKVALSGPVSVKAGVVSTVFTVSIQDEYSNDTDLSSPTVFSLTKNPARPSGEFSSSSDGSGSIASLTIASGTHSGSFYYKDTVVGTANLVATRTSGQALTTSTSNQGVTIMPADAFRFTVTGSTAAIVTGGTKVLTLTAYDNQGNVKTDYTGDVNVVFSGATASPAPAAKKATCSNKTSQDMDLGLSTTIHFTAGIATTTAKLYKAEDVVLKATAGTVGTATEDALSFTVKHGAGDHLKFTGNLPVTQTAGVEFNFDTTLSGVDFYDNVCDGANGATAFSGSRQISWDLSGADNGPEGDVIDEFVSPVTFEAGVSTTPVLKAKLYRAQQTTLTASTAALTGTHVASNTITVSSGPVAKLKFAPEPAAFGVTSQALTIQPKISVSDQYGNPVSATAANVTLDASTTTGTFTPVVNGTLSATGGLTVTTVGGVASYAGLTYNYPENIYLRATVSGVGLTPVFSSGITFGTANDGSVSAGAAGAAEIPSLAYTAADKVTVLNFRITDGGADGFATKVKQVIVKRNAGDATGGWSAFLKGAYITDGATQFVGTIEDNQIVFGLGTNDIYSVLNGTVKNLAVSVYLKNPLPAGSDNKALSFKIDPATDIILGSPSSGLTAASALTASPRITVTATDFIITGAATMNAGDSQEIALKATDALGNMDVDYSGEKTLIFSGANVSFKGNVPIETSSQSPFGTETPVSFTAGQNSSTVGILLYTAETVFIKASEGGVITTANKNALNVRVAGGAATGLSWYTQPAAAAAENAVWKEFSIIVVDAYGNTSSSSADVTVTPSRGVLSTGVSGMVAAQAGFATFYDFAVKDLEDGEKITLNGTASGLTPTGASNEITISKKYSIILNVKDSVSQGGLNNLSLTITDSTTGQLVTVPTHNSPWTGNSPFKDNFKLPSGSYTLSLEREEYVGNSKDVMAGAVQDGLDGTYDGKISWDIYMTSIAESMADYKGIADFVYDEDTDTLNITQRLERRGQQKLSDGVNNLGTAIIEIYDGVTRIGALSTTPDAQGNYWYSIPQATTVVPNGPYVSTPFTTAFISGKAYFAKCRIFYGGLNGDTTSYGSGTTFSITVTQRLSREIINSIGVAPGGTALAARIDSVAAGVAAVSAKVDTKGDEVIAKVDSVATQVAAVYTNVTAVGAKVDTVQGTVGAIQSDVSTTLPAKILANMEKGVMSEMLTRNTVLREDDEIKIRYRTASGLAPKLTVYTPEGTILDDYNAVKMTEINKTGIYEYAVTATGDWGAGEFTVECSEATKGSKDSMVLTVKALYTAGAGVQESVDAVGDAVTKVYMRQKGIEALLGTAKDTTQKSTIFAKVMGVTSKLDSLNLTNVSSDARDAKENAENVYNEIKGITENIGDVKAQSAALKQLSSQLEEMRANLTKASKSLGAVGAGGEVTVPGGGTSIITGEGGAAGGLSATDQKDLVSLLKDAKGLKKNGGVTEADAKDLNNRIEELTALVKVLGQMVENTNNKPIIEGWLEQG